MAYRGQLIVIAGRDQGATSIGNRLVDEREDIPS
jgi:hypothetical protein